MISEAIIFGFSQASFAILHQLVLLVTSVFFFVLLSWGCSRGTSSPRFCATALDEEYVSTFFGWFSISSVVHY